MRTEELFEFLRERHSITLKRAQGLGKPWTNDPILRAYKFCSVYRELDTVTKWIATNWRDPNKNDPELWFAMSVARFNNWPDTLAEIEYPVPWNPKKFVKVIDSRVKKGLKAYTGAYMISAGGVVNGMTKAEYIAEKVLSPLWAAREHLRPDPNACLGLWHEAACEYEGVGSFMAAQIVCDFKQVPRFKKAPDWWTFAASGPGSRRGLNRVLGRGVNSSWSESEWRYQHARLCTGLNILWNRFAGKPLCAQDCQSALCEFDKYERVRLSEGYPRSKYPGV